MNVQTVNQRCSCFNLRRATRAVTQHFDHILEPSGVRSTQFTLLVSLASVSAKTLTEMANSLVMDRTTLTRNLKPLEKLGLIETMTPRDKRSKAYALSPKGREILAKGLPMWEGAQLKLESLYGSEHYSKLLKELESIVRVVGEL